MVYFLLQKCITGAGFFLPAANIPMRPLKNMESKKAAYWGQNESFVAILWARAGSIQFLRLKIKNNL